MKSTLQDIGHDSSFTSGAVRKHKVSEAKLVGSAEFNLVSGQRSPFLCHTDLKVC